MLAEYIPRWPGVENIHDGGPRVNIAAVRGVRGVLLRFPPAIIPERLPQAGVLGEGIRTTPGRVGGSADPLPPPTGHGITSRVASMNRLLLTNRSADEILAHRDDGAVSVQQFIDEVRGLAETLPARPHAINLCRDRYRFSRAFAAAVVAGQTNLLPTNRLAATVSDLLERYPDAYVLSDEDEDRHWPHAFDARFAPGNGPSGSAVPHIPGEQLAAIVFTSGSTGRSKAIGKPWHTFCRSSLINAAEMGLAGNGTRHLLATVPPQHMYGLETSVLIPLMAPVAASSRQPFMPADIAAALERLPAPRVLISTPAHLRALADPELTLPRLAAVWSATGPLDPSIAARIEDLHDTGVHEVYGCSEVGSMARRETVRDDVWTVYSGFTLTTEGGQTHVSAAHLPLSETLQDLLEHVGPGRFRVIGRVEDLINVAGKRASLADLNHSLLRIDGVEDGIIFEPPARPDTATSRLAALVVAPGLDADSIRSALRREVDEAFLPRPVRMVSNLPRAETGKLPRDAVLAMFEATQEQAR